MTNKPEFVEIWEDLECVIYSPEDLYNLTLDEKLDDIRLDNVVVTTQPKFSTASFCYAKYSICNSQGHVLPKVIKSSLDMSNLPLARTLLHYVAKRHSDCVSNLTIASNITGIKRFIAHVEQHYDHFPETFHEARNALESYISYLKEQVKIYRPCNKLTGELSLGLGTTSASMLQRPAIEFLINHLDLDEESLTEGIGFIRQNRSEGIHNRTETLEEPEVQQEFNYYTNLFRGLSDAVLNNKTLPYNVQITEATNIWFFPYQVPAKPFPICPTERSKRGLWINYLDGNYYTRDYLTELGINITNTQYHRFKTTHRKNFITNNAEFSFVKLQLANIAIKAYFMHFLILTGMNDSTIARFPYGSFKSFRASADFKTIKWRAATKRITFDIQSVFFADFKKYLQLRHYLLSHFNQKDFKYLFIGTVMGTQGAAGSLKVGSHNLNGCASRQAREKLSEYAPFELSNAREFRVTKGTWVREKYGTQIASYVLQHSPRTHLTAYTGADKNKTNEEMSAYFEWLDESFDKIKAKTAKAEETETGHCNSHHEPDFIDEAPDEFKSCGSGEGCLWCKEYRAHPDDTDIRKLISLKYIINELRVVASNNEHFEKMYNPLLARLDYVLDALANKAESLANLIEKVNLSVFDNEELHPYWQAKLEHLIDLGIIS